MATSRFMGRGDVVGPSSATDGALCAFDGTTGKLIKVAASGAFVSSITGTANQVIASAATGAVTLSLPQSIATTSSPTFADVTVSNLLRASATSDVGASATPFRTLYAGTSVYSGDGTANAPSFAFGADTDTGFYRIGNGRVGLTIDGTTRLDVNGSRAAFALAVNPDADNTRDLGASGTQWRTLYAGTSVVSPAYTVGATAGASFSGAITNLTVVNGIVTAAS